jgi:radical SAM protein (TIGR01212 family)
MPPERGSSEAPRRFFSRGQFWRQKLGQRVWRVSLDGGLGCPNRDGTLGDRGCIFCDPASFSPSRRRGDCPDFRGHRENGTVPFGAQRALPSITAQLDEGIRRLRARYKAERFVAYFQPGTNTYGPVERLRAMYEEALAQPAVVALAIGTRPDCVSDEVLDLLAELARRTLVSVEYGLQTIHDRTLQWLGRGHGYGAFLDAVRRSRALGLEIGAHVILGLPGESIDDMHATAAELARLRIDSVKLHNLCAIRGTRLAEAVERGEVRLPEMGEYVGWVVDFLERLPRECVIDRLSGDAPPEYLLGPRWCLDRSAVRAAVEAEFRRRDTWQGHAGFLAAKR